MNSANKILINILANIVSLLLTIGGNLLYFSDVKRVIWGKQSENLQIDSKNVVASHNGVIFYINLFTAIGLTVIHLFAKGLTFYYGI